MPARSRPPTARLRRLASEMSNLRKNAGLSREDVEEQTGINKATLYRIETAKAKPQPRTLRTLLKLYKAPADKRDALLVLLREANRQGWLQPYQEDLSEQYNTLMGFEAEAQAVWTYGMTLIPGLLQTEAYARAVIKGMWPAATSEQVDRRVAARLHRQELLTKDQPLKLWAIVDEAALRRKVGSPAIMREQTERLRASLAEPVVTVQVLTFGAGAHPAMLGAFDILKFGEPISPDIVYLEGLTSDLFLDDETDIGQYADTFEHLRASSASQSETDKFLADVAREI